MTAPGTMTLAELQRLIADSKGEWEHIEFKKTTGELHGGMETLCGFLNGSGGKVLFGVTTAGKVQGQVNALCHRDYSFPGRAVNVAIYDDRLEVISTGLLPAGISVADLKRKHISLPRNPLIAGVFYRRGLIEQWGRGTQKIVNWCVAAGQPEPEFEEQAGAVVVRFRPSGYHPPLRISHDLTERQRRILQFLADGKKRRFREIYEALADAPPKRTVQAELRMLRDLKLVDFRGHGGSARWWLHHPGE